MGTICQAKQTTLTFLAQIYQKMDLGLKVEKTNAGITLRANFQPKWTILTLLA